MAWSSSGRDQVTELDLTRPATLVLMLAVALAAAGLATFAVRRFRHGEASPHPFLYIALSAVLFAWAAVVIPPDWRLAASWGLAWALLVLATMDALEFRLPDLLTLPLIAGGFAVSLALPDRPIASHLAGAVAGFTVMAGLAMAYRRLRGREGLGLGDAKLLAAAGAWLGWQALPSVVLVACAAAILLILARALLRGRASLISPFPFGLALCFAFWITWLHGPVAA